MKKTSLLLATLILLGITLWVSNNDWELDDGTLNYTPNRGKPLFYCLSKMDKAFAIRVMLPLKNSDIQDEIRAYYKDKMPEELNKSLNASSNLHNPTLTPLRDAFTTAFKSTSVYKKLENELNSKGYWIDDDISFEKFSIFNNEEPYLFHADIWLQTIPFLALLESAKTTFPNYSEIKLSTMFKKGLWNYEKSAVVVYPPTTNKTSIYLFVKNELGEFIGVDISKVEHGNIRKIGSNRHFQKIETKAKKWIKNEKYYQIYMETKAWSKGQRYRAFEPLLIDKSGRVLWR